MSEIIISAAIEISQLRFTGKNHSVCIGKIKSVTQQGFIAMSTVNGGRRFVDRKEALEIAIRANQKITKHHPLDELLSEDLYDDKHYKKESEVSA